LGRYSLEQKLPTFFIAIIRALRRRIYKAKAAQKTPKAI